MSENVVVFDLETRHDIASVGGYDFLEKLGLSVGVAYHVGQRRFYDYEEHQAAAMIELLRSADLIVGYNIRRFDFRVLVPYGGGDLVERPLCDMMDHVERALGHRVKLDSLAKQTLGVGKSADGSRALEWWREGRIDLIRDYCRQDVDVTRRLWEYGRAHGHLWYWDNRRQMRRPVPVRW